MYRSVAIIAWAIGLSQPSMPVEQRKTYARVVQQQCKEHSIDPFTVVSLVHHESRWRASAVSPDGEDFGLGQIRARYRSGCRRDIPAAQDNSLSCRAVRAMLLDGAYNIRQIAKTITAWRKKCNKVTGRRALLARWLHGYGGMTKPKEGIWCNQRKVRGKWQDIRPLNRQLQEIINHRRRLIRLSKRHKVR